MRYEQMWREALGADYSEAMRKFAEYKNWLVQRKASGPLEDEEFMATKLANEWLLGCDPEFVVLDAKGRIINTGDVLTKEGEVGYDHSGHVVELRPQPAKGTFMILKRLKRLMDENAGLQKLRAHKWRAGAILRAECLRRDNLVDARGNRTLTLGGHVHLDMAPRDGEPEFRNLLEALDRMTNHLEQLDILPRDESLRRRALPEAVNQHYGQWRDWRKAGARNERMEYRVMASWLFHPHTAYVCLTGAKLCAIAPMLVNEYLKPRACAESNLRNLFEQFRHRDSNVRRLCERLLDGRDLKFLQHDPAADFKEMWRELGL